MCLGIHDKNSEMKTDRYDCDVWNSYIHYTLYQNTAYENKNKIYLLINALF